MLLDLKDLRRNSHVPESTNFSVVTERCREIKY